MSRGTRTARRRGRARVYGLAVVVAFAVALWIALTAANGLPGSTRTTALVEFDTVGALRVGDDVRIADLRVGDVKSIGLRDGKPLVTMSFDGSRALYRNATAAVAQRSALGQAFVNVDPGTRTAGRLAADSVIHTTSAEAAQDLTNVLDVLDARTRSSLQQAVQQAGGGAAGHAQDVHDALAALPTELPQLGTVASALNAGGGSNVTALLRSTQALARTFAGQQQQIAQLLKQTGTTLTALNDDHGQTLARVLQQAPSTLTALRTGLGSLRQPLNQTHDAVVALRPGAAALGAATPDLRGLLREAVSPLNKVPSVAAQAVGPVGDLTTLMADASPLAPVLATTVTTAATPLAVIAPYSPDVSLFFTYATSALHDGDAAGHWLRFYPVISTSSVDGTLMLKDPLVSRDPYPAPGRATHEKQGS